MLCPRCQVPLIVVERNKIEVDYCLSCKGLWFDSEELNLLNKTLNLNKPINDQRDFEPANSSEQKAKCPRCNKQMDKVVPVGADKPNIDRCPQGHGLWFDAGELSRLFQTDAGTTMTGAIHFLGEVFGKAT